MLIDKLQEYMRLRNYSPKTINAYSLCVKSLYDFFHKPLNQITEDEFKRFLVSLLENKKSPYTVNLYHAALKLVFEKLYQKSFYFDLSYAKRDSKLPVVLSRKEIERIIDSISNPKHKLMIAISYAAGLRVSEVVSLRISDLDLGELIVHIKQAKGRKDRISVLPDKLKDDLRNLVAGKKGSDLLFESFRGGKLSSRSVQKVFATALKRSKVNKFATFHSLRHSFATHLLENGIDVRYVQELLGHQNIRTTQRYTQVTNPQLKNIKSPL